MRAICSAWLVSLVHGAAVVGQSGTLVHIHRSVFWFHSKQVIGTMAICLISAVLGHGSAWPVQKMPIFLVQVQNMLLPLKIKGNKQYNDLYTNLSLKHQIIQNMAWPLLHQKQQRKNKDSALCNFYQGHRVDKQKTLGTLHYRQEQTIPSITLSWLPHGNRIETKPNKTSLFWCNSKENMISV